MAICPFCSYSESAVKQRALAQKWDDQGLRCLGTPHEKAAVGFEGMASSEDHCKCSEPNHGWPTWEGFARYK